MLVVNARFQTRPITGVERYAHELTRQMRGDRVRFETPPPAWRGGQGHIWEQLLLPARVAPHEWLFSPANTGPVWVRRQLVTIHDLSPLEHPEWFARGFALWYRWLWPVLARRVQGILTDSDFSRQRIMTRLQVPPEKVRVVPVGVDAETFCPVSPARSGSVRAKYGLSKDFLLFVGSIQPRKNLSRLIAAWETHSREFSDLELVVAGTMGPQFHAHTLPLARDSSVRFLGYIPDAELPALYAAALGLVHPSLYEGSGLTVLEAMACGCPVLAANNTALPEVIGDAGMFFNPYDETEMAACLHTFLSTQQAGYRLKGQERARHFTWKQACDKFHEALHQFQIW